MTSTIVFIISRFDRCRRQVDSIESVSIFIIYYVMPVDRSIGRSFARSFVHSPNAFVCHKSTDNRRENINSLDRVTRIFRDAIARASYFTPARARAIAFLPLDVDGLITLWRIILSAVVPMKILSSNAQNRPGHYYFMDFAATIRRAIECQPRSKLTER